MEKVIAVVVTYNRQQLLSQCIDALRSQTRRPDTILVVNNGSTDNTEDWLKIQKDIIFISQGNTGSAGGFHTAIQYAFKNGYTWTWCMD
ncbi:MAG: glycosyltransferase, partial [Chitinophagaceae bacterium]